MRLLVIVLVLLALLAIAAAWLRTRSRQPLRVDRRGVWQARPDGREDHVAWEDLVQVSIVTTAEGVAEDDVFFLLQGDDGNGCAVGSAEARAAGLIARLERLPGFDAEAVGQASRCTVEAHFICWQGRPGEGLAASELPS